MAKLAMNAGEAFVFYRDNFEKGIAAGNIVSGGGNGWEFNKYYAVADEDGEEWLKRVGLYNCYNILCLPIKASKNDMNFSARFKHNSSMGYGSSSGGGLAIAVAWGANTDVLTYGSSKRDASMTLTFKFTSATNLQIIFGAGSGLYTSLDKLLPACSYSRINYAAKHTQNMTLDATAAHDVAASFDSKTGLLIVTVDGAEVINQIFSGAIGSGMPAIEDWQPGYCGIFFGEDVQMSKIFAEFPTEGGEDEPEEEWRPLAEINRMGGDAPLFALLIESEGCEPLAIAQGYKDVWLKDANGEARLFTASGMTIELPERKAGSAAALNFGIADVSGEAMARCEQLRDSAHPIYVTCLEYASHGGEDAESAPEPVWHLRLFGTSAAITPKGATFSAGWHDTLNAKYPYRRYTAAQFPGLKYVSSSI